MCSNANLCQTFIAIRRHSDRMYKFVHEIFEAIAIYES